MKSKIEHLREDNTIKFFTNEMKNQGKSIIMKQYFDGIFEYSHLIGDIPDKINEIVDAINELYACIEQTEK